MKVLLDHCVDARVAVLLEGHSVRTAREQGWEALSNGKLLAACEAEGFEVIVTVDKGFRHQQNVVGRPVSLITLEPRSGAFEELLTLVPALCALLATPIAGGQSMLIQAE